MKLIISFIIISLFLISTSTWADSNNLKLMDLYLDYQQGLRELRLKNFELVTSDYSYKTQDVQFNVENNEDEKLLMLTSEKLQIDLDHSLLNALANLPDFLIKGFSLENVNSNYDVSFDEFIFGDKETFSIKNSIFSCSKDAARDVKVDFVSSCTTTSSFKIDVIDLNSSSERAFGKMIRSRPVKRFKTVRLDIEDGRYYLSFWFKKWKNIRFRTWGRINFDQNQKIITISVQKVKVGIIPYTSSFLEMLKKYQTEKFKVELNKLFIYL